MKVDHATDMCEWVTEGSEDSLELRRQKRKVFLVGGMWGAKTTESKKALVNGRDGTVEAKRQEKSL